MGSHRLASFMRLIIVLLLLGVGGVLTACGDDSPSEEPTATQVEAEADSAVETDSGGADAAAETDSGDEDAAAEIETDSASVTPPAKSGPPTTVAEAVALLNLPDLALPDGKTQMRRSEAGSVDFQASQSVAEIVAFYRDLLSGEGWQETADSYVDDSAAAVYFTKDGYAISLAASDTGDGRNVTLMHHGNIVPASLPQTTDAENSFTAPNMFMYFSPTRVADVARFVRDELTAQGWREYTRPNTATADDPYSETLSMIQNGLELSAYISTAPAQDNKTAVQYTVMLLPLDMPIQPEAGAVQFDSSLPYLSYRTAADIETVTEFYRQAMADVGWEEIADSAVTTPEQTNLTFVSNAQEMALNLLLSQDDNQTVVTLGAGLEAPLASDESEMEADADSSASDTLMGAGDETVPSGEMPPIPLPDDAENVTYDPDFGDITFASATSIADLSEFYRQEMEALGWQEDDIFSIVEDTFAAIDFTQGDETISLTIFDMAGGSDVTLDLSSASSLTGISPTDTGEEDSIAGEPPADAPTYTINDWPVPPDATEVNLSGEILSYKVAMPVGDVAEFYRPTFELMEFGTGCLDDAADYTSLSCSSSNGYVTLNFFAFEGFDDTEVEIDFVNNYYPVEGGSSGGDSGELTAEDNDGLPLPSDNSGYFSEGSDFSRKVIVTSPSDIPTLLKFFQTELTARGWEEEDTTAAGNITTVNFSGPDGILIVSLAPSAGETEATLAVKNPTAAEEAGVMPPAGQARLFFINFSQESLSVTVDDQTIEVPVGAGMDSPDTAPFVDLSAGSYTVSFNVGGQELSDTVEVSADESWGLLLDDQGVLPILVY